MTKFYPKEQLQELLYDDNDDLEIVEDKIIEHTRWSVIHEIVFRDKTENKYYITQYSRGATEQQDESPFEYDNDKIECREVEKIIVEKIEWREK